MSHVKWHVMEEIRRNDGLTLEELATNLNIPQGRAEYWLSYLRKNGWLNIGEKIPTKGRPATVYVMSSKSSSFFVKFGTFLDGNPYYSREHPMGSDYCLAEDLDDEQDSDNEEDDEEESGDDEDEPEETEWQKTLKRGKKLIDELEEELS